MKGSKRLDKVTTYYFAKKLAEIARMNATQDVEVINLGVGSPDLLPPKSVIETLNSSSHLVDANKYQSYRGIPLFRNSVSEWYNRHFGIEVNSPDEILPLLGSKEGIMHLHMSMLDEGDEVLVPNPGYPAYSMTALLAGGIPRYYNLTEAGSWLPNIEKLEQQDLSKVKIMWINYPHMPTGARIDIETMQSLVDFAKRNEILLCHDNPYIFILNDNPMSIFQVKGAKDCCVELISMSKCYNMAGWRIGAMIGNADILNTVLKFKSNMDSGMYKPLQIAAAKALSIDRSWFDELNEIYARRRKIAFEIMNALDAEYDEDSAGMFVWGKVPSFVSCVENFCDDLLLKSNVFITPGHIFGSNGEGYIRVSLCNDKDILHQALDRIKTTNANRTTEKSSQV